VRLVALAEKKRISISWAQQQLHNGTLKLNSPFEMHLEVKFIDTSIQLKSDDLMQVALIEFLILALAS
jgi:hypothetical protein